MRHGLSVNYNYYMDILALVCILLAYPPYVVAESAVTDTDKSVLVEEVPRIFSLHRFKRTAISPHSNGFTAAEKEEIVTAHNDARSSVKASNMMRLEWSRELEKLAQNHAERCVWEHSSEGERSDKAGFKYIGENLYGYPNVDFQPTAVVQFWSKEGYHHDYYRNGCDRGHECGHYTQVIWAATEAVGCGIKFCSPFHNSRLSHGYLVVCNYGEGGNVGNLKPYMKGEACTACPRGSFCVNNLCSRTSSSRSPSGTGYSNSKTSYQSPSRTVDIEYYPRTSSGSQSGTGYSNSKTSYRSPSRTVDIEYYPKTSSRCPSGPDDSSSTLNANKALMLSIAIILYILI